MSLCSLKSGLGKGVCTDSLGFGLRPNVVIVFVELKQKDHNSISKWANQECNKKDQRKQMHLRYEHFSFYILCIPVSPGTYVVDQTRLASDLPQSSCLCLPSAGTIGVSLS